MRLIPTKESLLAYSRRRSERKYQKVREGRMVARRSLEGEVHDLEESRGRVAAMRQPPVEPDRASLRDLRRGK